ncbi:hypothetical protein L3Q82_024624, partial [Scortum barcoo]
ILILLSSVLWTRGENCPATCLCPDPHTVDCSGRGLTRLPDEIPLDVRRLLLADNWIPRIPSDFLVLYSDLVYLDLRNNTLSHIEPGTLSTSSRLVFLDLGSNNLTEIPKGTFGESRSLIKLRLGNNPYLSMVSEEAFLGLTSLRELELERNALSTLKVGALSQLPSLRVVRLEGNPWVCNCNFANLFAWLMENSHKLPNAADVNTCQCETPNRTTITHDAKRPLSGVEGMECSLPMDGRRVSLTQLSKDSFRECQATLTLTDLLIIIFSGISVSVVAIMTSFFLASTVHCFQRWSKGTKGDEEESPSAASNHLRRDELPLMDDKAHPSKFSCGPRELARAADMEKKQLGGVTWKSEPAYRGDKKGGTGGGAAMRSRCGGLPISKRAGAEQMVRSAITGEAQISRCPAVAVRRQSTTPSESKADEAQTQNNSLFVDLLETINCIQMTDDESMHSPGQVEEGLVSSDCIHSLLGNHLRFERWKELWKPAKEKK